MVKDKKCDKVYTTLLLIQNKWQPKIQPDVEKNKLNLSTTHIQRHDSIEPASDLSERMKEA